VIATEDLPGLLIQAAVIFALFVLPVLRGIVQSRQKQRELREKRNRGEVGTPPDRKAERKGLGDWERLLRGERVEPRQGERPKPPVFLEQLFPELVEEEPPPPTPPPPPRPRPAPKRVQPRERAAEQDLQVDFEPEPRPELEAVFEGIGRKDLAAAGADRARSAKRARRRRPRRNWKRAVALAEVLGPPVSLREGGAWPGGPRGL